MERIEFSKRLAIERAKNGGVTLVANGHPILTMSEGEIMAFKEALYWIKEGEG